MGKPKNVHDLKTLSYSLDSLRITHSYEYDPQSKSLKKIISYNQPDQSYLWGHGEKLPVAEILNCSPEDFAYTSFEEEGDNQGNWNFVLNPEPEAFTGNWAHRLSTGETISTQINSPKEYTLEFYYSGESIQVHVGTEAVECFESIDLYDEWNLFKYRFTPDILPSTVSIKGEGLIDNLRLRPTDSRMTTYTYDPLNGMTSKVDESGLAIFYEYDDFGRLALIRNHRKEILQQFNYFYYENAE